MTYRDSSFSGASADLANIRAATRVERQAGSSLDESSFARHLPCRVLTLLLLSLVLVLSSSCGRKGPPEPPEAFAPSPVRFLTARGVTGGVELKWQAPFTKANGDEIDDLRAFEVRRSSVVQDEAPDFDVLAEVPPIDEDSAAQSTTGDTTPAQTENIPIYQYLDTDVVPGEKYEYVVLGINDDGVAGIASVQVRVTFVGESSVIELFAPQL